MKALRLTCRQCAYSNTIEKKTVLTCGLRREESCSKSCLGGFWRCSARMPYTTTTSKCRILKGNFYLLETNVRHSAHTTTSKQSPLTGAKNASWLQELMRKRLFLRVQVFSFMCPTLQWKSANMQRHFSWSMSSLWTSPYLLNTVIFTMRGLDGKKKRYHACFISSHVPIKDAILFACGATLSIPLNAINATDNDDNDDVISSSDIPL